MPHRNRGDLTALAKQLNELEISVAEVGANVIAYTTVEPLFCIERASLDELKSAVSETLASYVSTFYNVERQYVNVNSEEIPRQRRALPIQSVRPVSRLRPNFANLDSPRGLLAMV